MRPETHARHHLSSTPDTLDDVLHLSRYDWAIQNVSEFERAVLVDLGCGTGFGLERIGKYFQRAVGVDFDPAVTELNGALGFEMIDFVCENVCANRLADLIKVRDADLVISMETIEHLEDYFSFLRNAVEIMSPTGTLIVGTPNRSMTYARYHQRQHMDQSHVQEFTATALAHILNQYFESVELYFQCIPGFWSTATEKSSTKSAPSKLKSVIRGWVPLEVRKMVYRVLNVFRSRPTDSGADDHFSLSDVAFARVSTSPEWLTDAHGLMAICRGPRLAVRTESTG
jgi:2-polyprenyl-3-methyl-5-hydroxy-6-metoxy-1,4-benzoquinol methylase